MSKANIGICVIKSTAFKISICNVINKTLTDVSAYAHVMSSWTGLRIRAKCHVHILARI